MHQSKFLWGVVFTLAAVFNSTELFAETDAVAKRQKLMKDNGAAAKAIKAAAEAKDYATIEAKAKNIISNGDKVLDLFPKGMTAEKTKARPEIWEQWDEFSNNPGKVKKAATELASAARAKDDKAISVKVKALGSACASCHESFRAEKYSK
jgi:cytochrome c556